MKILVTGQNSYAGTQFAKRITELNKGWGIDFVSVRDNAWEQKDFSLYDAIYHVAGIVHKKETAENKNIYYKVNRDLTYQLALKAKKEGVKSFVFLSTMAVYGLIGKIGEDTIISRETEPNPTSNYGKSKLEAEGLLEELQSSNFNISILRIPMIYGPNCPGNYNSLSKLARKIPVFPKIDNKRSMIFVDHLSD
ncbi:NAD-dependent epimerase/dehydratase family protein, partial [Planomicrobium sp. MB-3u-38]|uniref:NAD-dependent epimerase/dehydratase family protein n=1 Tax=Planomicrobium sp. MB-3u-38 TaxID=2058318 RepID=UPI000C7A028E